MNLKLNSPADDDAVCCLCIRMVSPLARRVTMCSWVMHAIQQCLCACSIVCLSMHLVVYYLCVVHAHLLLVLKALVYNYLYERCWVLAGLDVTVGLGNGGTSVCHCSCCGWCALALRIAFC